MRSLRFKIAALAAVSMLWSTPLAAAEVDQFTRPDGAPANLPDSTTVLNQEVNRRLQLAVQRANARIMRTQPKTAPKWIAPGCDEERLYTKLVEQLARSLIGQLESFAEESEQITRRRVPLQESIYQDFAWQASPSLVLSERMASVIHVNGVDIGTDKLGHFFTEGFSYFVVTDHLHRTLESGLLFGEWSEAVYFGAQTTGVFSYADLTANFHGLRFWNRILALHPDPLTGQSPSPYVVCVQKQWRVANAFHWSDYVDAAWDESINCPLLRDEALLTSVREQNVQCRTDQLPRQQYGRLGERLLNPSGHGIIPEQLQPEVILRKRADRSDVDISEKTLQYVSELRARIEVWRRESIAAAKAALQTP
ncbi:hypothetical protein [Ketobacter sp.]|uniref:hypothetical protein n=1 Tax=Ketobacter sp. TaxID=2083498 RepID=UPI000F2073C0|nr:hypothetical protein [Ketobacter sp.]RLT96338.1 MAG: hypothetical protein D9N14_13675 [Ketobacter sp.]